MGTIRDPLRLSSHLGIDPDCFAELGVFDPTLNVDTKLFIDPLLLADSSSAMISDGAARTLRDYFGDLVRLLQASDRRGDIAWREARRRFEFHEVAATCLGYGAGSIIGSGFGAGLTDQVLTTAKEIVDLGVEDPDLFLLLPLLEEGIGPDRISDMTTNIIIEDLARFTTTTLDQLDVTEGRVEFEVEGSGYRLLENPCFDRTIPVLLLPTDILRELPVASDWGEVQDAAARNARIRRRVNEEIGEYWRAQTKRQKRRRRERVLQSPEAVQALLDAIRSTEPHPYNLEEDPAGHLVWRELLDTVAREYPAAIDRPEEYDVEHVSAVVDKIIDQFEFIIEDRRLSTLLWYEGKPRRESVAQKIFFAVAYSYCRANNLDITPEADTGSGEVDFKVSHGFESRVLVELKLSRNHKLVDGYEKQLAAYEEAEETRYSVYLVVDVGNVGEKGNLIVDMRRNRLEEGGQPPRIHFVDGVPRDTASER